MRRQFGSRGAVQSRLGSCLYVTPDAHESPSAVQCKSGARVEGMATSSNVDKFEDGAGVSSCESSNVAKGEAALAPSEAVVVGWVNIALVELL